jgi:hypothetical protein
MSSDIIRDWNRGDPLAADHWQESIPVVRSVRHIQGDGCDITQNEMGTSIVVRQNGAYFEHYLGVITNKGPNGQADFTGNGLYWVKIQYISGGFVADPLSTNDFIAPTVSSDGSGSPGNSGPAFATTVPVTNLPEIKISSGRMLQTDGSRTVHVFAFFDGGKDSSSAPSRRLVMAEMPSSPFVVNLSQNGGADGNKTTYATWTYDVYIRLAGGSNGVKIGSTVTVLRPRSLMCSMIVATIGTVYFDPAGTLIIADAWEQMNQNNC